MTRKSTAGVPAGKGRVWSCLKSNEDRLSQACKDHMAEVREKSKAFMEACRDDRQNFCKGIPAGKGRIASCLKSNQDRLSADCKAYFDKN